MTAKRPHEYALNMGWRPLLIDLGVSPDDALRRAGLPLDLFSRTSARLSSAEFFRLWESVEAELDDPLFPVRVGEVVRSETFSPPLFAALCSPDLLTALSRLQRYKPLIAPIRLDVCEERDSVRLTLTWLDATVAPPTSLVIAELVFFVALARLATRERVRPLEVTTTRPMQPAEGFERYFGARVRAGAEHSLRFSRADARRPFLTFNDGMWSVFEPALRKRLAELDASATIAERVRATLLEGLPSGRVSMDSVARALGLSKRTLQRRLSEEDTTYKDVLRRTREALARHYLRRTSLSASEISFLLGFEEPNSFYRAFSSWTGQTPESLRQAALQ
ncbi:MAG: AraC family transcriptional regulator [Myxococcales bacterium]|nr:AraC family transcriptional regulator [Myxococcales bacterium]